MSQHPFSSSAAPAVGGAAPAAGVAAGALTAAGTLDTKALIQAALNNVKLNLDMLAAGGAGAAAAASAGGAGAGAGGAALAKAGLGSSMPSTLSLPSLEGAGMGMNLLGMAGASARGDLKSRKIYIGGIPAGISELHLQAFFNETLNKCYAAGEHCRVTFLNQERKFAFIEFSSPELAVAVLGQLDGIKYYDGSPLKLKKPNDFMPALRPVSAKGGGREMAISSTSAPQLHICSRFSPLLCMLFLTSASLPSLPLLPSSPPSPPAFPCRVPPSFCAQRLWASLQALCPTAPTRSSLVACPTTCQKSR